MGVADALNSYVAGAAMEKIDHSELIKNTHRVRGHRSWKVIMEYLREQQPWPGMRQGIWKTLKGCKECYNYNISTTRV
jgi:Integrase zinc binding domain